MEFYPIRSSFGIILGRFQFPMGWNSTQSFPFLLINYIVSIPNGMEFYQILVDIRGPRILVSIPNGMEFYAHLFINMKTNTNVSIPNGMEFYLSFQSRNWYATCFNSQWDGILLAKKLDQIQSAKVSIPNGMEFYFDMQFRFAYRNVSIPNGMEFYHCAMRS